MTFEEYLSSLKGKTVGVIGVGVSNRPLIGKLLERGIDVTARDKKEDLGELGQALTAQGCKLRLGSGYLADLHEDVIFRTPGLRPDVPELAAAVAGGRETSAQAEAERDTADEDVNGKDRGEAVCSLRNELRLVPGLSGQRACLPWMRSWQRKKSLPELFNPKM